MLDIKIEILNISKLTNFCVSHIKSKLGGFINSINNNFIIYKWGWQIIKKKSFLEYASEKQSSWYSGFGHFNFVYINIATKSNVVNS